MDQRELTHHGVLGMKWGVRRTPEQLSAGRQIRGKSSAQKASEIKKRSDAKNRGSLSKDQLKEKIERLKLEKELRELTNSEISSGKAEVNRILRQVGTKVATNALTGASLYALQSIASKKFDRKEFGSAIFNGGPKKK